jgi:uncharacterized membrane protein
MDNNPASSPFVSKNQLVLVYLVFALGVLFPVLAVAAAVLAYVQRGKASDWLPSHYAYLIRTFWWGFGVMMVSALLLLFKLSLGVYLVVGIKVWIAYRLIVGGLHLHRGQAIPV